MLAKKLNTFDDLLVAWQTDESLELVDGQIVSQALPRFAHSNVQSRIGGEYYSLQKRAGGEGGWWICTDITVRYSDIQAPRHDLAGWRKERIPSPPTGVMTLAPDWVCEIVSPGHEKKDTLQMMLLLLAQQVPYYWIVYPEDKTVIVHMLHEGRYVIMATEVVRDGSYSITLPPFDDLAIDLGAVFAGVSDGQNVT
ncbi:Hypothetical protein HDN1F_23090 [gamma proteobacterium HdN1]|nr:Hypothetical protein HDN1F_23090 [gamma proteobacterium HdN1]